MKKYENREREKKQNNVCVLVFKLLQNLHYKWDFEPS